MNELNISGVMDVLDIIYVVSIPVILYLLLRTERSVRKRLDSVVKELREVNKNMVEKA